MVAFFDLKDGLNAGDVWALSDEFSSELIDLWQHINGTNGCPESGEVDKFLMQNPSCGIAQNLLQVVCETFLIKPHILKDIARNFRKLPFHTQLLGHVKLIADFGSAPVPIPIRIY